MNNPSLDTILKKFGKTELNTTQFKQFFSGFKEFTFEGINTNCYSSYILKLVSARLSMD